MASKDDRRRRRRLKKLRSKADWQAHKDQLRQAAAVLEQKRRLGQLAACGGGGRTISRQEYRESADALGEQDGAAFAYRGDPDLVAIEGSRVVNRGGRAVEVSVVIDRAQGPGDGDGDGPDAPRLIETLDVVKIPAGGFIDFATYGDVRPLCLLSPFAGPDEVMDALRDAGFVNAEPPDCYGPWQAAAEVAGVSFSATHLHNANESRTRFVAVCRGETEGGDPRCMVIRVNMPGEYLGSVESLASHAEVCEVVVTDAERAAERVAEAASWREVLAEEVAAGKLAADQLDDEVADQIRRSEANEWIDPQTVELLAVVKPGTPRDRCRELYDLAVAVLDKAAAGHA